MINKAKFNEDIEEFVYETGESYIDAVVHVCDQTALEMEIASKMLNKAIREKIEAEASELNMLKEKICTLPI